VTPAGTWKYCGHRCSRRERLGPEGTAGDAVCGHDHGANDAEYEGGCRQCPEGAALHTPVMTQGAMALFPLK